MKFAIVVLGCLIAAAHAQYTPFNFAQRNPYNPFNQYNNRYNQNKYNTPVPYRSFTTAVPVTYSPVAVTTPTPVLAVRPKAVSESRSAATLKFGNEVNPDGSYLYFYETDNGIAAQEEGTPRNFGGNPPVAPVVAQGAFSWISPEGETISIKYVADENGYHPQGDAIPTPPAIPEPIARALEYIARTANTKK